MQHPYILYLDILAINDNYLRKLAGIQRYAAARGWEVETLSRDFQGRAIVECRMTDSDHTNKPGTLPSEMPPHSFLVAIIA